MAMASAGAAQDTGSWVRAAPAQMRENTLTNEAALRQTFLDFGDCVIASHRNRVQLFIETPPGSRAAYAHAKKLAEDDCLDMGRIEFSETVLRSSVYEALYRTDFVHKAPPATLAGPVDYARGMDLRDPTDQQLIAMRQFADCTARANPASAHDLLLSAAGSAAETKAFDALAPFLAGCLPQGRTLRFSKIQLRGAVGETFYRIRTQPTQNAGQ